MMKWNSVQLPVEANLFYPDTISLYEVAAWAGLGLRFVKSDRSFPADFAA